jgi:hypothetical protein
LTQAARQFLLREGTNLQYGARHLKRAIERHVVAPLANLLATDQIQLGDVLCVDFDANVGRLEFLREGTSAISLLEMPAPLLTAQAAEASGGRAVEIPAAAAAAQEKKTLAAPPALPGATNRRRDTER